LEAVGVGDGFRLAFGKEPGVGLAVVAYGDRAMSEMDDFDVMGVAGGGRRLVVVPPMRCRCRTCGD
jgi:hypothetical protein